MNRLGSNGNWVVDGVQPCIIAASFDASASYYSHMMMSLHIAVHLRT